MCSCSGLTNIQRSSTFVQEAQLRTCDPLSSRACLFRPPRSALNICAGEESAYRGPRPPWVCIHWCQTATPLHAMQAQPKDAGPCKRCCYNTPVTRGRCGSFLSLDPHPIEGALHRGAEHRHSPAKPLLSPIQAEGS